MRNSKYQENVLENFIKNAKNRNDRGAMFKVYLNNPNYYVKQEDILANVCGNGSRDVRRMMNSLGIHKGDPSTLTYGQLLKQCNII